MAAVSYAEEECDIVLNLNNVKSIEEVIEAISHEVAHIVLGSEDDTKQHKEKWKALEMEIAQKYFQGGVSGGDNIKD